MKEKLTGITRRRALTALVVVGLVAAFAGVGTMAYFSDTEQSTDNAVQAGTLDLTVNGGDDPVTTLNVSNVAPGDSGTNTTVLENTGSLNGSLDINVDSISDNENGMNDPESDVDTSSNDGELAENLNVTVTIGDTQVYSGSAAGLSQQDYQSNVDLDSGESKDLTIKYSIDKSVGNEIQSDSVTADFTIELNQEDSQ